MSLIMASKFKYWRKRILLTIWISYAAFYLCRMNMSVALPGIMNEFGFTKTMMGMILTGFFITYAAGQFINAVIGDKVGARKLVFVGMLFSAIMNILFGFTNGVLGAMILVWSLNGFFLSMGWGPIVKTIANWFNIRQRGKASGVIGTSYLFGGAVTIALSGFIIAILGWKWVFWIPAIILLLLSVHWVLRIRNAPEEVGLPTIEDEVNGRKASKTARDEYIGLLNILKIVIRMKRVWATALALFCLNIVRFGFMSWAPTYLIEVQKAGITMAAIKTVLIPLTGSVGVLFVGWVTDKFFKTSRAPVAAIMLLSLAFVCWMFAVTPSDNQFLSTLLLALIGFLIYGPLSLMTTTMPMDFGTRKAAAFATGFIDGWGYIGAALTGVMTGLLVDNVSWSAALSLWISGAFIGGVIMSLLGLLMKNKKTVRVRSAYH